MACAAIGTWLEDPKPTIPFQEVTEETEKPAKAFAPFSPLPPVKRLKVRRWGFDPGETKPKDSYTKIAKSLALPGLFADFATFE